MNLRSASFAPAQPGRSWLRFWLLSGLLTCQAGRTAEVTLPHRAVDAAGGRVTAAGVTVDTALGAWGTLAVATEPPTVRLQGGLPGRLNEPPSAPDQIWHRTTSLAVKQRVHDLLAKVSDPENDSLQLVDFGPSVADAVLQELGGWLLYAPPPASGDDQFPYWIEDAAGGRAVGTIYVLEEPPDPVAALNRLSRPRVLPDGHWLLRFLGIPGRRYRLEYADDLTGPWQPLPGVPSPWVAPPDGLLEALDFGGVVRSRFYRVVAW